MVGLARTVRINVSARLVPAIKQTARVHLVDVVRDTQDHPVVKSVKMVYMVRTANTLVVTVSTEQPFVITLMETVGVVVPQDTGPTNAMKFVTMANMVITVKKHVEAV